MSIPPRFFPNNPAPKSAADADSQQTPNIGSAASAAAGGTPQQPGSAFRPTAQSPLSRVAAWRPLPQNFLANNRRPARSPHPRSNLRRTPRRHPRCKPRARLPLFGSRADFPLATEPAGFHISLFCRINRQNRCRHANFGFRDAGKRPAPLIFIAQSAAARGSHAATDAADIGLSVSGPDCFHLSGRLAVSQGFADFR